MSGADGHPGTRPVPRTDWASLSMDQLVAMLGQHQSELSDEHIEGWSMAYELLDYHGSRLRDYRSQLAERWPATSSPAAAAFLTELDGLISSIDDLGLAAPTNNGILIHVVSTLTETKAKLEPIAQQWHGHEEAIQKAAATNGKAAGYNRDQQTRLHSEAVQLMFTTGGQVTDANQSFVIPSDYQYRSLGDEGRPLPLPPPDKPRPHTPSPNIGDSPHVGPIPTPGGQAAPVLTGGETSNGPIPGPPLGTGASNRPAIAAMQPEILLSPGVAGRRSSQPTRSTTQGGIEERTRAQVLHGTNRMSQSPTESHNGEGSAERGMGAPLMGGSGRQSGRRRRSGDPYYEWNVPTGVPAVLRPPDEPVDHDPGPIFGR